MDLGTQLSILIGPTVAVPAPGFLVETLLNAEVTHDDTGRSGFQLTFNAGRKGVADIVDFDHLSSQLLRISNRVILTVILNGIPNVLFDGIITNQQLEPSNEPGQAKIVVTGEDVSVMMDMMEVTMEHPAQLETVIALKIIAMYAQYGLIPMVIPPVVIDPPIPIERTPVQSSRTDYQYLNDMAERYGYIFYIIPGPAPLTNTAYWGPPIRVGFPQPALSIDMGSDTNVSSISFQHDGMKPQMVMGTVQDSMTNQAMPVMSLMSLRPPLSLMPSLPLNFPLIQTKMMSDNSRYSYIQAFARAQGMVDKSVDEVVTASGELDVQQYGTLLRPRELVGVRGAGFTYDGLYYVKKVSHKIAKGSYTQSFTLTREGTGAITPMVPV